MMAFRMQQSMTVVEVFIFMQLLVRKLEGMQKYSGTCLHNRANM
jgi:hypothetical protein